MNGNQKKQWEEPRGTCYEDAWRFLSRQREGWLVHGQALGKNHAWVETEMGYVWEPQSRQFYKKAEFLRMYQACETARYDWEKAALMAARTGNYGPWEQSRNPVKLDEVSTIELPTYKPHRMTEDDWNDAGGSKCPRCNNDTVRLVSIGLTGKIKMCPDCIQRRRRLLEHKRRLTDIRFGNLQRRIVTGKTTT